MIEGYTFFKEHKIDYEWKITEISSHLQEKENGSTILESSEFSTGAKIKDKWRVGLFLNNGISPERSDPHASIYIHNLADYAVTAEVTFFILTNEQNMVSTRNFRKEFEVRANFGFSKFIKKENLLNNKSTLIPNDVLTICVEVMVTDDEATVPVESSFNSSKSPMVDDIKELYNSRANSDVTVIIGDKEFQAHKIIIMARSPVFDAMFTHEMIEKKSKQVSIPDIRPEIFEKVLEYIYTDEVTDLDVVAADLLEAANKYQILSLKNMCEHSLCTTLDYENAVKRIILADLYHAEKLLDYISDCIVADSITIIDTDGFEDLEKSNPPLALRLVKKVLTSSLFKTPKITYLI